MSIDGGVPSDQAIGANNTSFDGFAGLHHREQRDHAAQRKIDALHCISWLAASVVVSTVAMAQDKPPIVSLPEANAPDASSASQLETTGQAPKFEDRSNAASCVSFQIWPTNTPTIVLAA